GGRPPRRPRVVASAAPGMRRVPGQRVARAGGGSVSTTSTTDVTGPARPSVQPPTPWAFPAPSSDSLLDNGLRVLTYDVPGQYVISASLTVPRPLSTEPRAVEGIASLMASLLDEGTTSHTSEE